LIPTSREHASLRPGAERSAGVGEFEVVFEIAKANSLGGFLYSSRSLNKQVTWILSTSVGVAFVMCGIPEVFQPVHFLRDMESGILYWE
jgi:hypothetical protein